MGTLWHRGVIEYLHEKVLTPKDIHVGMVAPIFYATVKWWAAQFRVGKGSLEDDDRCGRPTKRGFLKKWIVRVGISKVIAMRSKIVPGQFCYFLSIVVEFMQ